MKRIFALALTAGIFISSCSMPTSNLSDSQISTAAALTVQAVLDLATPLATPMLVDSPAPSAQPTPTFSQTMASVGDDAINCRKGPGVNYERVTSIKKGEPAKIVGFFPPNFWVVSTNLGECWISGEFTTPVGNLDAIPTVTAPPTPKGGAPEAPTFPQGGWKYLCDGAGHLEVTLNWKDNAVNETGYRVYRDNVLLVEFPANTTQFYEQTLVTAGQVVTYTVIVHNEAGEANSQPITLTCQ